MRIQNAPGTRRLGFVRNVGYAVAVSGDLALLGAPQLLGRPPATGVIDTDGGGYAFVRRLNPPGTKILPQVQSELIEGAQTNTLAGTLDGTQTATLQFFDIREVTLQTIRVLTAVVPAFFLALGIWIARGYPLTRAAHARILSQLEARGRAG